MKALVETTGEFQLHDMFSAQTVCAHRPTVVELTPILNNHRGTRLTVIEILADDATDEALYLAKDEDELAAAIAALPRPEAKAIPAEKPAAKPKK